MLSIYAFWLVTTIQPSWAEPQIRPIYGIEPTLTSPSFQEMCPGVIESHGPDIRARVCAEYALSLYRREYPAVTNQYGRLVRAVFGDGEPPPPVLIRLISELAAMRFWILTGPDIEAQDPWIVGASHLRNLESWLEGFDRALVRLRRPLPPAARPRYLKLIVTNLIEHPLLAGMCREFEAHYLRMTLAAAYLIDEFEIRVNQLLIQLLKHAFFEVTRNKGGTAVELKHHLADGQPVDTLEFRRIPAQEDTDEAMMWMRLLEGHWRRAFVSKRLVPLRRDASDDLVIFSRYVHASGMNALDFARYLPAHLRRRVTEDARYPRWARIRERAKCEWALAGGRV